MFSPNMFSISKASEELHISPEDTEWARGVTFFTLQNSPESSPIIYEAIISELPFEKIISAELSSLLNLSMASKTTKKEIIGGRQGALHARSLLDITNQAYLPPKHIAILTDKNLHILLKLRPIDLLANIFLADNSKDFFVNEMKKFTFFFGRRETCAMLIQMICDENMIYYFQKKWFSHEVENAQPATQLEPLCPLKINEQMRAKALSQFHSIGFIFRKQTEYEFSSIMVSQPKGHPYSKKVEAVLLYLSRLIRPIWHRPVVNEAVLRGIEMKKTIEGCRKEELQIVREKLAELGHFISSPKSQLIEDEESLSNAFLRFKS